MQKQDLSFHTPSSAPLEGGGAAGTKETMKKKTASRPRRVAVGKRKRKASLQLIYHPSAAPLKTPPFCCLFVRAFLPHFFFFFRRRSGASGGATFGHFDFPSGDVRPRGDVRAASLHQRLLFPPGSRADDRDDGAAASLSAASAYKNGVGEIKREVVTTEDKAINNRVRGRKDNGKYERAARDMHTGPTKAPPSGRCARDRM